MDLFKVTLTSLLSVATLFIITKIMGHKQVAELDFFDYLSGITIGSIGAEMATELESPERPLIALLVWGAASVAISLAAQKIPRFRKYSNGTPTILMDKGKLYRDNLKKSKLDLSEFMLMCREAGYFDLEEIETVVFEHNGRLSILPKAKNRPLTPDDIRITVSQNQPGVEVIMDGRIMGENLCRMKKSAEWLNSEIRKNGYKSEKDIFLAIYRADDDKITIYPNK